MKSPSTIAIIALSASSLMAFAPSAGAAAPAAPAVAPSAASPASSVLNQLDPAVRNYLLAAIAKSFEAMGELARQGDAANPVDLIFGAKQAISGIPTDNLPSPYKDFIQESNAVADRMLDELKALGSEAPTQAQLQQLEKKYRPEFAAIEAKYPEAAALLGEKNTQAMGTLLIQELGIQQKAMQYVAENKEKFAGKSQQAIMGEIFIYISQEIAKQIK